MAAAFSLISHCSIPESPLPKSAKHPVATKAVGRPSRFAARSLAMFAGLATSFPASGLPSVTTPLKAGHAKHQHVAPHLMSGKPTVAVGPVWKAPTTITVTELVRPASATSKPSLSVATKASRVSLEFVNTDIVQILRALALQTNVNIVAAPEVKGALTVSLNDVDVEDALKMVTGMSGLGFARVGETILVAPRDRMEAMRRQVTGEPAPVVAEPISEAYLVRGGKAEDLVAAVAGKGQTSVGPVLLLATPADSTSRQTIVLRGPEAELAAVRRTIEQIDAAGESSTGYEIYEVKHLDPRALREELISAIPGLRASVLPGQVTSPGIFKSSQITKEAQAKVAENSGALLGDTASTQSTGSTTSSSDVKSTDDNRADRETMGLTQPFQAYEKVAVPMKLVLRGPRSKIDEALAYLAKIDVPAKQVALELRVMELTKDQALRVGLDWSILSGQGTVKAIRVNQNLGDTADTTGVISGAFTGKGTVTATLDALATDSNLIARPNLLAVDGRSAELFVGDVIRYIETIQTSQNGTTVQTGEEHVGVRLAILPRVGADGTISMELRPIVSYLTGYTAVPGGGQLPQTSERIEQTTSVIRDGDTIALGGLIQVQDRKTIGGIPLLKDLPIVGQLFRRTDKDRTRTEVVFFLTAKIVDPHTNPTAADPRIDKKVPDAPVHQLP